VNTEKHLKLDSIPDLEKQLRVELKKADAVRELGRVLGATLDLDRLLERLLEKVTELLDAERASLFLLTADGSLESTVAQGPRGTMLAPIRVPPGKGIAGWVATSGETVNIPDAYADARFDPSNDQRSGFRTRSILCMSLPDHGGKIIGVIQVLNKRGRPFDEDDEALLQTVAAVAGINIENARLYASVLDKNRALLDAQSELRGKITELDLLYRIEMETAASNDQDELVERLLARAVQLVDAGEALALLREPRSGELHCHRRGAALGADEGIARVRVQAGEGLCGWVALHKQAVIVNDPKCDARIDHELLGRLGIQPRNIVSVPLVDAGADDGEDEAPAIGALELYDKRSGEFDDEDRKLLTLIAGQAARALAILRGREERARSTRLEAIGQLVSGLLHDLRTPVTIASGYTQLMAESGDAAERNEYAGSILKQFELLSAMTGEVLAFVRGESNLLVRKVFLNRFAQELEQQLQRELEGHGVELVMEVVFTGIAYFDELKLYRAIHNLARNAAQAMPTGGRFVVRIASTPKELVLSFSDNGPGIPDAMRGRLFTAFSTSGKRDGTGLGLAMVKKIIDEHSGHIRCESEPGQGTTFHIALPLGEATP
jgi:signal transduction histidine kinase